ncbi:MAG: ABC1 kinase family protein, partial [Opitutales bacterium]
MRPRLKPLEFFSNTVRVKDIIGVLARRGFSEVVHSTGLPGRWARTIVKEESGSMSLWERLRRTLEDLGPTYVKFGQVLSSRPDVLPEAAIHEFKKLRTKARSLPFEQIEPVLLAQLPGSIDEHFSRFDRTPAASGSMAQVHQARLRKEDIEVAVKVQRPGIHRSIRADIEIISWLARKVHENSEELRPYDLPELAAAAADGILQELDFTIEANNAILFNHINPFHEDIFAPRVFDRFTTDQLTVCEWVEGAYPGDEGIPEAYGKRLAVLGGKSVFHQIVIAGFFHGDPHSGNLLVTPSGRGCLLDWGLAGQLTREMRYHLGDLFAGIANEDAEKVCRVALLMAESKARPDRTQLEKEVSRVLRRYSSKFEIGQALGYVVIDLLYVFGNNGIKLARDYSLLAKAIVCIEEVGLALDPTFDIRKVARPFLHTLNQERFSPFTLAKQFWYNLTQNVHRIRDLPQDMQRFLRMLEDGEIQVHMRHEGVDEAAEQFSSGVNRITLAL